VFVVHCSWIYGLWVRAWGVGRRVQGSGGGSHCKLSAREGGRGGRGARRESAASVSGVVSCSTAPTWTGEVQGSGFRVQGSGLRD
jgi:hypothetical protein